MRDLKNTCRVAVVQATPVMFRKDKCLEKTLRLIDEAAGEGAEAHCLSGAVHPRLPLRHDLRLHRGQPQGRGPRGLEDVLRQLPAGRRAGDA